MLALDDIRLVKSRPARGENLILTIYVDFGRLQATDLQHEAEKQLSDMLAATRNTISTGRELRAYDAASGRMLEWVGDYRGGGRSLAAVFDVFDGFFWSKTVDFPVRTVVRWARTPFLLPLILNSKVHERIGIVLLNNETVRIASLFLEKLEEHFEKRFDRNGSAPLAISARRILKDVISKLEAFGQGPIILAGNSEITGSYEALLPKRISSRVILRVDVSTSATADEIRTTLLPLVKQHRENIELSIVNELMTAAARAGQAVTGLRDTLTAVNHFRIRQVVYAVQFRSPGQECPRCAALFLPEFTRCSFCGSDLRPVDDIVELVADRAVRNNIRIEALQSNRAQALLIKEGGIGAFLRTRTFNAPATYRSLLKASSPSIS